MTGSKDAYAEFEISTPFRARHECPVVLKQRDEGIDACKSGGPSRARLDIRPVDPKFRKPLLSDVSA